MRPCGFAEWYRQQYTGVVRLAFLLVDSIDIAETMAVPVGTIKSTMHRAIARLREVERMSDLDLNHTVAAALREQAERVTMVPPVSAIRSRAGRRRVSPPSPPHLAGRHRRDDGGQAAWLSALAVRTPASPWPPAPPTRA
ncbi:MAG: hypothetical protein ACRDZ8_14340 [Acidimicrobiales bacterium]